MRSFEFYNPTKIVFGNGTINRVGLETSKYGTKALLITTRGSIKNLGIFDGVKQYLDEAGIASTDFFGIEPNPKVTLVIKGAKLCKENNVDVIVALGGGSVIDCAKAIAIAALDDGDPWDFFIRKRTPKSALPVVAVLTLSGTGSEMNVNSVVTNLKTNQKTAIHYEMSFPKVSIIDPQLQITVPVFLTACGMVDTIAHVLENYFGSNEDTPLQDRMAEGIVQTVLENDSVLCDLENITKRANLAWASTLALNGIVSVGREEKPFYAHKIEHEIGGRNEIIHAAGLSPILPSILEKFCHNNPQKFKQFSERIFGTNTNMGTLKSGLEGIRRLRDKFEEWGMPMKLSEAGVKRGGLDIVAQNSCATIKDEQFSKKAIYELLVNNF